MKNKQLADSTLEIHGKTGALLLFYKLWNFRLYMPYASCLNLRYILNILHFLD